MMSPTLLPRDLLRRCASNFPDKTAYYCGEDAVTWSEMLARASHLAAILAGRGVRKGRMVAFFGGESLLVYEHFFACMLLGAVRLGINRRYTAAQIAHVLEDSKTCALLWDVACQPIDPLVKEVMDRRGIELIVVGGEEERRRAVMRSPAGWNWPTIEADDPLLCTYTSGTTGHPKGVMHSHGGVARMIFQSLVARGLGPDDVWATASASSWMTVVLNVLGLGNGMAHLVVHGVLEMSAFLRDVERRRVTALMLVPTLIRRAIDLTRRDRFDLSALRLLMYGSEPATPRLIRDAYDTFQCELVQSYGMTEAGWLTQLSAADHRFALAHDASLLRSAGRPGVLCEISIRNDDAEEVPASTSGTVWARGAMPMLAYVNRPEATAEVLRDGWIVTNDVGYLDQRGYLFLTDRRNFMIVTGGVNVFPSGVEAVLAEHPDVGEVAVVGMPDPEWGEIVVAALKVKAGHATPTPAALRAYCRERLNGPERPKRFCIVEDFPRGVTGKLDKRAVKELIANGSIPSG